MTHINIAFDLSAMADRLIAEKRLQPIAGLIRRVRDLHSLTSDLKQALDSLDILISELNRNDEADDKQRILESSLLNNAIIMYARATRTTSKERAVFDIIPKLNADQLVVHNELYDLRTHAVAHFGSGGSYDGMWQKDLVVLHYEGNRVGSKAITLRQSVDRQLILRARSQIEVAFDIIKAAYLAKHKEMDEWFGSLSSDDMAILDEALKHPLRPEDFVNSPGFARSIISMLTSGNWEEGIGW